MNKVFFIGLGLEFNVPRIAFKIGNLSIFYYSICIVIAITFSLILSKFSKETFGIKFDDMLEIFIFSLVGGVIGARFYYILFNLEYYLKNLNKILSLRDGGMAIYGGIIFGIFIAFLMSKMKKIEFKNLMDFVAPYIVLAQGIGRWGNFFNVEAYGVQTKNIFRMGIFEDGKFIEVHPCFLYESIACIFIFFILKLIQRKRKFKFEIFSLYMILYGVVRFMIEGIRADALYFGSIRISQLVSLGIVVFGALYILVNRKKCRIL